MEAPFLQSLELHASQETDFNFFKSSGQHLQVFSCHFLKPSTSRGYCLHELLTGLDFMPACHTFSIHLGQKSTIRDSDFDFDYALEFWCSFLESDEYLLSLKHLTITNGRDRRSNHPLELDPGMLISFVKARRDAGLPLTSLHLVNMGHFSVESIIELRQIVPKFTYRTDEPDVSDDYHYRSRGSDTESIEMYMPPRKVLLKEPAGMVRVEKSS